MGWSNYAIIEDLGLVLEIDRSISSSELDYFVEKFRQLLRTVDEDGDSVLDTSEAEFNRITLSQMSKLVRLAEKTVLCLTELDTDLLILAWAVMNGKKVKIVSEFEFGKMKRKKGWKIVRR